MSIQNNENMKENKENMAENNENMPLVEEIQKIEATEYVLHYKAKNLNFWLFLLITAIITILSIMSAGKAENSTVFTYFFSIVIVMFCVYYMKGWGVAAAGVSSLLFCLSMQTPIVEMCINVFANTVQALLMWVFFNSKLLKKTYASLSKNVTFFKLLLILAGIVYVMVSFAKVENYLTYYIISGFIIALYIIYAILDKKVGNSLFMLFVCLIPCIIGGSINSVYTSTSGFFADGWLDKIGLWIFSNFILLSTFGYSIFSLIANKRDKRRTNYLASTDGIIKIELSTAMFYISAFLWNIFFYYMFIVGWMDTNTTSYVFPWLVGNIFFILNMTFTLADETGGSSDPFKWFENRAVVAEKNTQMLIAIIAFLLPICANLLGTITASISFVFILNITSAVISIGLIWVPSNNIRFMAFVKHLKTIFHLFTVSLLLLNAIMIINEGLALTAV